MQTYCPHLLKAFAHAKALWSSVLLLPCDEQIFKDNSDNGTCKMLVAGKSDRHQARQKLCSLSKSRKKFGPWSSSVQVSTFNRFPIGFWNRKARREREEKRQKERKRKVLHVKDSNQEVKLSVKEWFSCSNIQNSLSFSWTKLIFFLFILWERTSY